MSPNALAAAVRPLVAMAALLPLAAAATPDFTIPVVVCVPGDPQTMAVDNKLVAEGVVRRMGRNTPPYRYFCPVFNPDFTAAQPSWRHLRLTYADNTTATGNVVVRLFAKSRAKLAVDPPLGTTFAVAQVSSVPGVGVQVASAAFSRLLDFHRFTYWLVVDMPPSAGSSAPVIDAHEVALTD